MPTRSELVIPPDGQTAVDRALSRAVVYRTLSVGFQMPGRARAGPAEQFPLAASALQSLDEEWPHGTLTSTAARVAALAPPAPQQLADSFVRLFGHTTRGLVCACETEYGADNTFHQPQQLADISGYYLAFGLKSATACDVRPDHVACECEFMHFLNCKEALLLATASDEATLGVTTDAARSFLRDHLGRFGRAFAARVLAEDSDGFYGLLGRVLQDLLEHEYRRLDIAVGPVELAVRPDLPDETPMACGTTPELIQIQRHR